MTGDYLLPCYLLLMMSAECLLSGGRGGGVAGADSP